jgi:hypothetical protein
VGVLIKPPIGRAASTAQGCGSAEDLERSKNEPLIRYRLDAVNSRAPRVCLVLAAAAVLLTGCGHQGTKDGYLTLSASESTLAPCPTAAPVLVEALDTDRLPECDPVGQVLVFPDGEHVQLPEQQGGGGSSSNSASDTRYVYQSVGNWGLVAARATTDCSRVDEWGNPEGLRRVHQAFGNDWACR